jgi:acylphosphatase
MSFSRKQLKIQGKVQGVGFRQNAFILAQKLKLVGWVRNTSEGEVELLVEGELSSVNLFVEWCHEGPTHAAVTTVTVLESSIRDFTEFQSFTILRTSS